MDYQSEDEQLEGLKNWWKANGTAVVFGVLLGLGLLFGFSYWKKYQNTQADTASGLYQDVIADIGQKNRDLAQATGGKLMADYTATPYAADAALLLAKDSFDAGDVVSARRQLQWVLDHGKDAGIAQVARLRLGRIMLSQNDFDAGLKLIDVKDFGGFDSEYAELKGDLLAKKGQTEGARAAYLMALGSLSLHSPYSPILQMKLDDLAPEKIK